MTQSIKYYSPANTGNSVDIQEIIKQAIHLKTSGVSLVTKVIRIAISPRFIGDELNAAEKYLHFKGYKYMNEIGGFLVHYENVEQQTRVGIIRDDQPCVYHDFKADFYAFRPQVDAKCLAKVVGFGKNLSSGISVSVLGCINALVSVPDPLPDRLRPFIQTERKIMFVIKIVDYENCTLSGVINEECINFMVEEGCNH